MRNKIICLSLSIVMIIVLTSHAREQQKPEWKGKVEIENGIKVIKNPLEPLYGQIKFDLGDELIIGRKDDNNYLFDRIKDVQADNEGNIYVADMRNNRIQKFDRYGKYLQTIGSQGTRRLDMPIKVRIHEASGNIYVAEFVSNMDYLFNMMIFDNQGNYVKEFHFKDGISDFALDKKATILLVLLNETDSDVSHSLCKINSKGEIEKSYAKFPYVGYRQKMGDGILSVSTGYELSLHLSKLDDQAFVYGYSKEYELKILDGEGRVLHQIKMDEPRPKFTSEEKSSFRNIPVPQYKPYFFSILHDSKGRIYVQRNMAQTGRIPGDSINKEDDVFSKEGHFLFKTTLPPNTCAIKDGFLYSYRVDEDARTEYVKRYRIKNWNQIKEGI